MVSYARPMGSCTAEIIDLELWPYRFDEYRQSGKSWTDFVYAHPRLAGADKTNIVLDRLDGGGAKDLPENYSLVAPFGISQCTKRNPVDLIKAACAELKDVIVLCPPELTLTGVNTSTAPTIADMAKAVRDAKEFWCINSAPACLAAATRKGKLTKFWGVKDEFEQDNIFAFDGLVRID